ncbi:centaurin-gamma-1A-like isoform X3 [Stomoxys calcitrans]|uniref:Uncharacterized protein n=1 Tax=Stomoxys calcitrans TaxID=35570 RepID=A0A1I8QE29_STOCA|nr:centaurin-gamma-1A-like isoform X3 [Stomoxys calcitrans]XP_059220463.1 centaurin-gamma-1A-like isoform X3 [Stomoxys calcitrans]
MSNYQSQTPPTVLRNHHQHHQQHHNNHHFSSSSTTSTAAQQHNFTTPAIPHHQQPVPLPAPPQPLISNSLAIRQEIQRFESVHPSIYAIYDLIDLLPITDAQIAQQIRDHVVCIEENHIRLCIEHQ